MKKTVKIVMAVCLACVCFAFACVLPSFAALVPGRYYRSDDQYTALTNTAGSSGAYHSGNYYGEENPANTASVRGECTGGPKSSFKSTLNVRLSDSDNALLNDTINSVTESTNILTLSQSTDSNILHPNAIGYVEATCTSKTDINDMWQINYHYVWKSASEGWKNPS